MEVLLLLKDGAEEFYIWKLELLDGELQGNCALQKAGLRMNVQVMNNSQSGPYRARDGKRVLRPTSEP